MKHPNKKVESTNKWKTKCWLKSCFNFWMDAEITSRLKVPLTHATLLEALANFDRNNK